MQRVVVMEFIVHDRHEFPFQLKEYDNRRLGYMTIVEPGQVEWRYMVDHMVQHKEYQRYKGGADLYYLRPGTDEVVLMTGPAQVERLLQDHEGRKTCDLYIVINDDIDED